MKELFKPKGNVKSYSQKSYFLNLENDQLILGPKRKSSFHYPHGTKLFDKNGNVMEEDYSDFHNNQIRNLYHYNQKNELVKEESYSNGKLNSVYLREYDEAGNLVQSKYTGGITKIDQYRYENSQVVEKLTLNENSTILKKEVKEYHQNGNIKSFEEYSLRDDGLKLDRKYIYNENGDIIKASGRSIFSYKYTYSNGLISEESCYDKNNSLISIRRYQYLENSTEAVSDENFNFIKKTYFLRIYVFEGDLLVEEHYTNSKDATASTITKFNKNRYIVSVEKISKSGKKNTTTYFYEMDKNGNVICLKEFKNDLPVLQLNREIEYF